MKPTFSEFSYGFALVNELIHWGGQPITAVPVYPSLIQEERLGYDVRLERGGVPLFIQFKLSHCMVRASAQEVRAGVLQPPFYRMHLYPRQESQQHARLITLEEHGNEVYYAAPEFHRHAEFNAAYLQRRVIEQTWFFSPSVIGPLPDDDPHHIAFRRGADHGWFCSKPQPMKPSLHGHALASHLEQRIREQGREAVTKEALEALSERLLHSLDVSARYRANIRKRSEVLDRLAFIAQAHYAAQLFIVQEKPEPSALPKPRVRLREE